VLLVSPSPVTWQEAARGIPVWEGCLATDVDGHRWRILETGGRFYVARIRHPRCGNVCEGRPIDLTPDLTDPDTRAAYDRRLALALGAPESIEACGVNLYGAARVVPGVAPFIEVFGRVGGEDGYRWCELVDGIDTTDPLLALALAWPADKRVCP